MQMAHKRKGCQAKIPTLQMTDAGSGGDALLCEEAVNVFGRRRLFYLGWVGDGGGFLRALDSCLLLSLSAVIC